MKKQMRSRFNIRGISILFGSYYLRRQINNETVQLTLGRVSEATKTEAEEKALDAIKYVEEHGLVSFKALEKSKHRGLGHNKMSLNDLLMDFLDHAKVHGTKKTKNKPIRKQTIIFYKKQTNKHFKPYLNLPITSITADHVEAWYSNWLNMKDKKTGRNLTSSADDALSTLSRLLNWAVSRRYIPFNPAIPITTGEQRVKANPLKSDKEKRINIITDELGRFVTALIYYKDVQNKKNFNTARDLIVMLLTTGARISELRFLKWSWIPDKTNFSYFEIPAEDKDIKQEFEGTKTREDYYYPCSKIIQEMLKQRYNNRHQLAQDLGGTASLKYVFPNKLGTNAISQLRWRLEGICKDAGINRLTPHDFRRTFVDICSTSKDDKSLFPDRIIKRAVHHKDSDITFGLYGMRDDDKLQLHQIFQHVEDYCGKSLGAGTIIDIFGKAHTRSGTRKISSDNINYIDERMGSTDALRLALYNPNHKHSMTRFNKEVEEHEIKKLNEYADVKIDPSTFNKFSKTISGKNKDHEIFQSALAKDVSEQHKGKQTLFRFNTFYIKIILEQEKAKGKNIDLKKYDKFFKDVEKTKKEILEEEK